MKITLDHNCIIHLDNKTEIGARITEIINYKNNECYVVNIGASEMRERGVLPDRYIKFDELLKSAQIGNLSRLNPMAIFDVTFFDHCVPADDKMIRLSTSIEEILFPNNLNIDIDDNGKGSKIWRKWLNRLCDIHAMWCHIYYKNELFLTTDGNFKKQTKLPKLIALGAGRICHPSEI